MYVRVCVCTRVSMYVCVYVFMLWDDTSTKLVEPPTFQKLLIEHYMCMYVHLRGACVLDSVISVMGLGYFYSHVICECVHLNMRSVCWSHDCCVLLYPGCVQAVSGLCPGCVCAVSGMFCVCGQSVFQLPYLSSDL